MAGDMEPSQLANLVQKYFHDWKGTGLALSKITLYETPNCWAEVGPEQC